MSIIAPSLLSADFTRLAEEMAALREAKVEVLPLDVMDGHFVKNITFGYELIKALKPLAGDMKLDVHLMMTSPLQYIEKFCDAGADILTVHVECDDDIDECLSLTAKRGVIPGLSLKPTTPADAVIPYIGRARHILIMTVEPGFGGQSIMLDCLDKAQPIRDAAKEKGVCITVSADGGVNLDNCDRVAQAGVDILVAGSAVFGAPDMKQRFAEMSEKVR